MIRRSIALLSLSALAACSFEPAYRRPVPAIPAALPSDGRPHAILGYRDVFRDPKLIALIDQALANNQDLKAALANVQSARALVTVARAGLIPQINGSAGLTTGDSSNASASTASATGRGRRTSYNLSLIHI